MLNMTCHWGMTEIKQRKNYFLSSIYPFGKWHVIWALIQRKNNQNRSRWNKGETLNTSAESQQMSFALLVISNNLDSLFSCLSALFPISHPWLGYLSWWLHCKRIFKLFQGTRTLPNSSKCLSGRSTTHQKATFSSFMFLEIINVAKPFWNPKRMANTYSISLEGSEESLHKQVALLEYCAMVGNVLSQHYKDAKQIRDVPSFNKWGFNNEKPEDNCFSRHRQNFRQEIVLFCSI